LFKKKVPKSGYLNTKDFKTVKQLAEHLIHLDGKKKAYNAFFKWKRHIVFNKYIPLSSICVMCIQLHLERYLGVKQSVIKDIGNYWNRQDCDANF
jgi:hypothetical protein